MEEEADFSTSQSTGTQKQSTDKISEKSNTQKNKELKLKPITLAEAIGSEFSVVNIPINDNNRQQLLPYYIAMQDGDGFEQWIIGRIVNILAIDRPISKRSENSGLDRREYTHDVDFKVAGKKSSVIQRRGKQLTSATRYTSSSSSQAFANRGDWVLIQKTGVQ